MSGEQTFNDLGSFIDEAKKIDSWREVRGVNWDLELGTIVEGVAESGEGAPMLIFDDITGYPSGHRAVALLYDSPKRFALVMGLPLDADRMTLAQLASKKIDQIHPVEPVTVTEGPVMERCFTGDDIDMLSLPVPKYHTYDGGRYIGTGTTFINRDPESGYVNMGTYRQQVHERNLLGLWQSPGQQGRQIAEKYWKEGKACPVVATYGGDPVVFFASHQKLPYGQSELAWAGGLRGRPVELIEGPETGLPIPAYAEIVIEGEVPPPSEQSHEEGPFGEWPGYYSGGSIGTGEPQPVIRVKALYHRAHPILHAQAPLWPGARQGEVQLGAAVMQSEIERLGIQGLRGVYSYTRYLVVVSLKQAYAGHALQAGLAVVASGSGARNGRHVIVVDEDIDPSNMQEVMWAFQTRCDPATDIRIIDGTWSTPLDPRMSPFRRDSHDYTNSRAIHLAVRPFPWKDKFPVANRCDPELLRSTMAKFADQLDLN